MNPIIWVGFAAFFFVSLAVGVRLLLLWRRTRELPELLIGIGVLGIGPVGFGCSVVSALIAERAPGLSTAMVALALLAVAVGATAKFVFNWRVYHPESAMVRAVVGFAAFCFAACFLYEGLLHRFSTLSQPGLSYYLRMTAQVGCLLWGSAEALRYWVLMRRRLRLGIADPVVANRFLLWGIGAGAAGVGSLLGILVQLATGLTALEIPAVMASNSAFGFTAAVTMSLAFLPPAAYTRWIRSRCPSVAEA
jgi:hypothetical protein